MSRILLVALLLAAATARAHAQGCPSDAPGPEISVEDMTAPVTYDFTHTAAELRQIANLAPGPSIEHGLTQTSLYRGFKVSYLIYRSPQGACAWPGLVTLQIGFQYTRVYVQDEYRSGTCESNAILQHENTHVSNAWESLRRHMPAIVEALRQATAAGGVFAATDAAAKDAVMARVQQAVDPQVDAAIAEQGGLDRQLDSPPSIQATMNSCQDW